LILKIFAAQSGGQGGCKSLARWTFWKKCLYRELRTS